MQNIIFVTGTHLRNSEKNVLVTPNNIFFFPNQNTEQTIMLQPRGTCCQGDRHWRCKLMTPVQLEGRLEN